MSSSQRQLLEATWIDLLIDDFMFASRGGEIVLSSPSKECGLIVMLHTKFRGK